MRHATRFDILQSRAPSGSVITSYAPGPNQESGALILQRQQGRAGSIDYRAYPQLIPSRRPKGYRRLAVPHANTVAAIMRQFSNVNKEQAIAIAYWRVVSDIRGY